MAEMLICGYYGFNNAGDEAILGGIVRSLRELEPAVRLTVLSGDPGATERLHGVAAIPRMDPRAIWRAVGRADVVLTGGGSLLQDVTSWRTIPYYLSISAMALLRRRRAMWYAQGVGPVQYQANRWLVRWVADRMDVITVRDAESAAALAEMGVRRVAVTADAAFALEPGDPALGRALLHEIGVPVGVPLVGVSLRPWQHMQDFDRVMARALDRLALELGGGVVFLPMQIPQDQHVAEAVHRHMRVPHWLLSRELNYQQAQAVVACLDLLVGLRYHALVFAAMSGVPIVGLSYDPKIDSFLHQLGLSAAGSPTVLDSEVLLAAARSALANREAMRGSLRAQAAEFRRCCQKNAQLAVSLAAGERGRA